MKLNRYVRACAGISCLLLTGCAGFIDGGANSLPQVEVVTASRLFRLAAEFNRVVLPAMRTGANANLQYDGQVYYYKSITAGLVTTISFYTDSGAQNGAGTITVTQTAATQTSPPTPAVYTATYNITLGNRPITGSTVTSIDPTSANATTNGTVTVNGTAGAFPVTLTLVTATSGSATGTATGTANGVNVTLANVVESAPSLTGVTTFNAGLSANSPGGAASVSTTLNSDGSGSSSLPGNINFTWNSSGTGSISEPSLNGTISIANVDNGV